MTAHSSVPCPPPWRPPQCQPDDVWRSLQGCWNEIGQFKLLVADIIGSMNFVSSAATGGLPPVSPQRGVLWLDPTGRLMVYDGRKWIPVGPANGAGAGAATGTTPPANPQKGMLWLSPSGELMVYDGSGWVPAGAGPIPGVTDGSSAAPGMVGETFTWDSGSTPAPSGTSTQIIPMGVAPAGDWDIWFNGWFSIAPSAAGFHLATVPAGMQGDFSETLWVIESPNFMSPILFGKFAAPASLALSITATFSAAATMGLFTRGRRMR